MLRTLEATIDQHGRVTLNEGIALPRQAKALVTILEDEADLERMMPALLSEAALAKDWLRPEEDAAWAHLKDLPDIGEDDK